MSINVWSILKFFAYVAIIMFFLFPIAWIFNMSFMTNDEILRKVPVLFYEVGNYGCYDQLVVTQN